MKRKHFAYIAAALLILNTVIRFILDFSGDYPYNVFGTFSIIIIPLLLSVVLITQHSNKTIVGISILVFAVLNFLLAARGFGMVSVDTSYIIPYIILPLINLINEVFLSLGLFKSRNKVNVSSYLLGYILIPLVSFVLSFVEYGFFVRNIIVNVMNVGFYIFLGLYVTYIPKKRRSNEASSTNGHKDHSSTDGYISMGKHIVLCLLTFGIWYLIWIYRTTAYLNRAPDSEEYSPASKLLLCMFVPFYIIFWLYKHGQRIDRLAKANNVDSDIATLSLIMGIFIPIVAVILMQDKINDICIATARKNHATPVNEDKAVVSQNIIVETASEVNGEKASARTQKDNTAPYEEIKQLKELLDMGIITQEEFDTKKKELLGL